MIVAALTTLAQRELGDGYLVRVTEGLGGEVVEVLDSLGQPIAWQLMTYRDMAAGSLSVCGQRREALAPLLRLVAAAGQPSSRSAPDPEPRPNSARRENTDSARRPGEKVGE